MSTTFPIKTLADFGREIVAAAEADWRADAGEHDRSKDGILDRMFVASTWSRFGVVKDPNAKVPDWCGMAVNWWQMRAGRNAGFAPSFLHTKNVEAFHTYGSKANVNPRRLRTDIRPGAGEWTGIADWHRQRGQLRLWTPRAAITDLVQRGAAKDLFAPGDTLLIDWHGRNDADHIAMVRSWDGSRWLECIEGNRTGQDAFGRVRRDGVVRCKYDLASPTTLRTMYGVGRLSLLDFNDFEVR